MIGWCIGWFACHVLRIHKRLWMGMHSDPSFRCERCNRPMRVWPWTK